jgi:hypothetical protein
MKTYITDPTIIAEVREGSARINGKLVLPTEEIRVAAKRIFFAFKDNPDLAICAGLGLCKKNTANQWRRLSVPEFKELVLNQFLLVREQLGEGGRCRLEVLDGPPPFWVVTLMQGRWLDTEVQGWFPVIEQPKVTIIARP